MIVHSRIIKLSSKIFSLKWIALFQNKGHTRNYPLDESMRVASERHNSLRTGRGHSEAKVREDLVYQRERES